MGGGGVQGWKTDMISILLDCRAALSGAEAPLKVACNRSLRLLLSSQRPREVGWAESVSPFLKMIVACLRFSSFLFPPLWLRVLVCFGTILDVFSCLFQKMEPPYLGAVCL